MQNLSSLEGRVQAAQDGSVPDSASYGGKAAGRGGDNDGRYSHLQRPRDERERPIALKVVGSSIGERIPEGARTLQRRLLEGATRGGEGNVGGTTSCGVAKERRGRGREDEGPRKAQDR
jgi:hypothetical protein